MDVKKLAVISVGAIVGAFAYNAFIAGRFVPVSEGFGMDDVLEAVTIAAAVLLVMRFV